MSTTHVSPAARLRLLVLLATVLVVSACAPTTLPGIDDAALARMERTAEILYHRMELGFLESGVYTTNVLIDAPLPEGARWTLQDFAPDGSNYVLILTSSTLPELAWRISPRGVSRTSA